MRITQNAYCTLFDVLKLEIKIGLQNRPTLMYILYSLVGILKQKMCWGEEGRGDRGGGQGRRGVRGNRGWGRGGKGVVEMGNWGGGGSE